MSTTAAILIGMIIGSLITNAVWAYKVWSKNDA